jgi:outer membrane protein assembly factor BamD
MSQGIVLIAKRLLVLQALLLLLSGCALLGFEKEEPEKSPEELMRDGMSDFRDGDYADAAKSFQNLKDRYPYSKLAVQAELNLADALFKREEFEAALEAYREFERLHPKNQSIPYVIYQQGMCYFARMNTIDRDNTNTKNALNEFERLKRTFPTHPYSLQAERKMRACYINLAEHEYYVGTFYFKKGHYKAALKRFEYLIKNYPDYGQYAKALAQIARCKEELAEQEATQ